MSREIKFRGWDKENKNMIEHKELAYTRILNGEVPEAILMQYTGLKDKNGVEIYEGDIVEWFNEKYIITYVAPEFVGKPTPVVPGCSRIKLDRTRMDLYRVIGNIYENPELLEEIEDEN